MVERLYILPNIFSKLTINLTTNVKKIFKGYIGKIIPAMFALFLYGLQMEFGMGLVGNIFLWIILLYYDNNRNDTYPII